MTMRQCWGRVPAGKQPGLAGQGQGGTKEQGWGVQASLDQPVPILTQEWIQNQPRDLPRVWVTAPSSLSPRPEEG